MAPTAVPHTTNGHVDIYNPIYHPILPHRHRNIDPSISTSNAHFRRLYDVYHTSLQRGNIPQAKRAYALLVRSKQFDWAANWRNGLDMVQLPFEDDNNGTSVDASLGNRDGHLNLDDPNTTAMADDDDLAELQARKKRLLQLKVDYLRECHIIHSRKAKKKYSLREPEEILLQLVLLLATANRHVEALNELEIYLPNSPYRDNALLHYYAGLLCIYSAQVEFSQDEVFASSQNYLPSSGTSSSNVYARAAIVPRRRRRSSSSSSTSSSSSSSSSTVSSSDLSSSDTPMTTSQRIDTGNEQHRHSRRSLYNYQYHTRKTGIKPPMVFYEAPTPEHVSKILSHSPSFATEVRKWFEKAQEIVKEQGKVFDDLEDWMALLDGRSMDDTQTARRAAQYRRTMDSHRPLSGSQRRSQSSHGSDTYTHRSILKGKGRASDFVDMGDPVDSLAVNNEHDGNDTVMASDLPPALSSYTSSAGLDATEPYIPSSASSLPFPSSSNTGPPAISGSSMPAKSKKEKRLGKHQAKRQKVRGKTVTWAEIDALSD